RQLIGLPRAPSRTDELERAFRQVERALLEHRTLVVLDDAERLLPPAETTTATGEPALAGFDAIAAVCQRLGAVGETRMIFVSRERPPAPFDGGIHRLELMPLSTDEAVELVTRDAAQSAIPASLEDVEEVADAAYGHAGTLARLGVPLLRAGAGQARTE